MRNVHIVGTIGKDCPECRDSEVPGRIYNNNDPDNTYVDCETCELNSKIRILIERRADLKAVVDPLYLELIETEKELEKLTKERDAIKHPLFV